MQTMTLPRDGQRPVRFTGVELARSSGASFHQDEKRYYVLTIYQLDTERYLVHWDYHTQWQGESNHSQVETYGTLDEAIDALETFDSCAWVQGYKAIIARSEASAEHYIPRQQVLEAHIRTGYQAQVSTICKDLDIVETL
jgi:hypothetical protein